MSALPILLQEDYFAAEQPIVEQLSTVVGALVQKIYTPATLQDVEKQQVTPALHVLYMGDRINTGPQDRSENKSRQILSQQWMVVVAVRNAGAQIQNTSALREAAGPIISSTLAALQGFKPIAGMRELERVGAPAPAYRPTFAYYPLMFAGQIIS